MSSFPTIACTAVLSVTLLGLGACGKGPEGQSSPAAAVDSQSSRESAPAATTAQTTDACALLTDEEFQQATGYAVHDKKSFPGEAPGCDWGLAGDPPGVHRLSVIIRYKDGRQRFDFVTQSFPSIPNLGDAAAKNGGNINGTVWAVKGDTLVTLNYALPVTTVDPDTVTVPLVRVILSRL